MFAVLAYHCGFVDGAEGVDRGDKEEEGEE
jgi:hypothetical protein